jgi:inhibitor of KinA
VSAAQVEEYGIPMKTEPLGDSAIIVREIGAPAHLFAEAVRRAAIPGMLEAMASYDTVGVYFDPGVFDPARLFEVATGELDLPGNLYEIPVCYDLGEDLPDVAERLGLKSHEIVRLHTSRRYRCYALGFCPGFAYLGHLPDELAGVPRRPSPRVRIEPGSVAITGRQTAVYPLLRPGGWALIGRTPLCLVDVEDAYFPIRAGDQVQFVSIGLDEFEARQGERL